MTTTSTDSLLKKAEERIAELESQLAAWKATAEQFKVSWGNEQEALQQRLAASEKQATDDKAYIEDLCAQLCKMEDALGFKNDCSDKDGAFVPTIGPWLERVRDLIAVEGELGDERDNLAASEKAAAQMRQSIADFVHNVKHSHVAGWEDVSKDTVADNSFKELQASISTDAGKGYKSPAEYGALLAALRKIKLFSLTTKFGTPAALGHICRLCIDAGVTEHYEELEALVGTKEGK